MSEKASIHRIFKTDDGKVMMKYLERLYLYSTIHNENMAREVGRRDVVMHLRTIAEKQVE